MTDINLTGNTDIEVAQITPDSTIISEDIIGGCLAFEFENGAFNIGLENGEDFCLENSKQVVIGKREVVFGDPAVFDLSLSLDNTTTRLKRALKTPLGYITMYIVEGRNINIVDALYGNNIYSELSEGLTLNFIARARQHTLDAISRAGLNADVNTVEVNISGPHTVDILISYRNRFEPTVIQIQV